MPTIKDIAKEAGVSHGTASNVLNGKGNVSVKKIQLVEEAARKLGYKMNYKAKSLRSGATHSVSIIIPSIESDIYIQLYKGLDKTLTTLGYRTHLYITYDQPHNEKKIIKEIAEERVTGIVSISCLDDANAYYEEIQIPREHIIFVNREVQNAEKFISFDFQKAGTDIRSYIRTNGYTTVGIFADDHKYSCERWFVEAILQDLKEIDTKVLHVPLNQSYRKSFEFFEKELPEIIITTSLSRASLLKNAQFWGSLQKLPEIVCLGATSSTYMDSFTVYRQNYHLLGHNIANLMIQQVKHEREIDSKIMVENDGIASWEHVIQQADQKTLTILTIPSPTTDALHKLLPHFTKNTEIKVHLAIHSYEEIYQILTDPNNDSHYDIIRMDMAWLSWFGKEIFRPLLGLNDDLDRLIQSFPPHMRDNYSQIEGVPYAIPFDPSIQMLFYRTDLFEDPKIKRMYYEANKKQLSLPQDFDAYNELVRFFSKSHFSHSPTEYGTSMTLGRAEIVAVEFLTRYYAANGKLVDENGVHLNTKIAAKALQSYLDTMEAAQLLDESWWGEAVNSFARGETAMVIGFMNHVSRIAHSEIGNFIGSASVPGEKPLLGGGVIGISRNAINVQEAVALLQWVNRLEVAEQISLLGGTSANSLVCNNQAVRTLYPWLHEAHNMNEKGVRDTKFLNGGGFNTKKMEQIIGRAIKDMLKGPGDIGETIDWINSELRAFALEF
ncbi:extracellular solute-binding protein [Paenibacillus sp. NPDC058910]|uniref:extracellular solute-binding protein n=1 Tax=unclassified Paenibacillus TaxID=185978 RepID=UPI003688A1A0